MRTVITPANTDMYVCAHMFTHIHVYFSLPAEPIISV